MGCLLLDFGLLETTNGDATLPATWGELVESLSSSRGGTDAIDTRLRASLDWLDAMGDRPLNAESAASAPIDVFCGEFLEKYFSFDYLTEYFINLMIILNMLILHSASRGEADVRAAGA